MRSSRLGRIAIVGGMSLGSLAAQSFDVASIRPSPPSSEESNVNSLPGGRLTATNITVRELIRLAFGVKDYQIARAPGWVDAAQFDIAAKAAGGQKASLEDLKSQARELLAERFHLATHIESKLMPVYLLVIAKDGSKLKETNASRTTTRKGCGHLAATRVTTDVIATMLSRHFERDVVNRTGLPGKYDFELDWTPDSGPCPAETGGPSIYTAVQQQLGLKLESVKGTAEILVIDRVERPSEN